ncbi:FtsX-like permease family protein [Chachezhania sediminis]|uniref:FtsX-like permease family protein n=1 Tax=Chachezhania sediminis TaxID=2599291 RepID=UPI00131C8177|nr:FtsX-like permease family protein [Chachezhania sediminis]
MIRTVLSALLSHWRRQPVQLVTLLAGLALATALWSAVQAINGEARSAYARADAALGSGTLPSLVSATGHIALDDYVRLRRAGWQLAPVLEDRARIGGTWVTVTGIDILSYPVLPVTPGPDDPDGLTGFLTGAGLIFAHPETASRLEGADDMPEIRPSTSIPPGTLLTDIAVAERLLDRPGALTKLLILPDQPMGLAPLVELAPDLRIEQRGAAAADTARLTDSFHLNLTAFGLLAFAVGLFIVHGAIGLSFEQRRPVFRTLRALGVPVRTLSLCLAAELALMALTAGLLGLVLGYLIAAALLPDVAASLRGLYGAPVSGGLSFRPLWALAGLGMTLAGTGLAGAQALGRLATMPILEGATTAGWVARARRSARIQILAALLLPLAGIVAVWRFDGLIAGFALLGGLLLGAAALVPPLLGLVTATAAHLARRPVAQWLWADMRAQVPGLSLALMALLLALATNVGVGTMVSSFRQTFTGWLDQRLASDLYVTAATDAEAQAMAEWLAPRVEAVLPIRSATFDRDGVPLRLYGIVDDPVYARNWPLVAIGDDAWPRVHRGQAILLNEQMARRLDLWPGDSVNLTPTLRLPVAGVYSDYGNPGDQAIVALPLLESLRPDLPFRQMGVRAVPGTAPRIADDLARTFALPPDAVVDQAGLKAASIGIFDKTFVVTGALNALTLGVAGFAILTSLFTLWTRRLPQIAPLWAMGMTRGRLARLEILRSVALSAVTALLALPVGLLLAWALLAVINVEAFGWRLPMYLFPADWLRLFLLALATGALAAALPALRLYRLPPSELLKVFAGDR